jgi:hypothetical protein
MMYCDSASNVIRAIDVAQQLMKHFGCIVGEFPRRPFAESDEGRCGKSRDIVAGKVH